MRTLLGFGTMIVGFFVSVVLVIGLFLKLIFENQDTITGFGNMEYQ
jgi:hypothetical protein